MLLSIIIPAYNAKPFIGRLLKSVYDQKMAHDIEVVISDDCSSESYDDEIRPYENRLHIVRTQTSHHYGYPSPNRQAGADASTGDWLTFMDQDDYLEPGSIRKVFDAIKEHPAFDYAPQVLITELEICSESGRRVALEKKPYGWTHGKFYRREFWEKHKLKYREDMRSHEDIYMSTLVNCALNEDGIEMTYVPLLVYHWVQHPKSITHSETGLFIENHTKEYIEATGEVYLDYYRRCGEKAHDIAVFQGIGVLLYCYFYHMGAVFRDPEGYNKDNLPVMAAYAQHAKETFRMSNDDILIYTAKDRGDYYWKTQANAMVATGPYIPCITFQQWLAIMAPEDNDGSVPVDNG